MREVYVAQADEIADRDRIIRSLPSLGLEQQWAYYNLAVWERLYDVRW